MDGHLEELGEEECLRLLESGTYGRVAVVHDGRPDIFPVNYVLEGTTVAFRTGPGTKLAAASMGPVAFEVEQVDPATRTGWVVVVHGVGREITSAIDPGSARVRAHPLQPWPEGPHDHWVAISSPRFSGRRLSAPGG